MNRAGIAAFAGLWVAFALSWWVDGRSDQYCFGPPVHNWAWHVGQIGFLLMLLSAIVAVIVLRRAQRKAFAIATVVLYLPLVLLDALRAGCN